MFKENIRYKQVLIAADTYDTLKELGRNGDSFNQVIKELLNKTQEGEEKA